jgi:hypothetical protein
VRPEEAGPAAACASTRRKPHATPWNCACFPAPHKAKQGKEMGGMERRSMTWPGSESVLVSEPHCFHTLLFPFWYSTHPGGSTPSNPMKTITEKFSSRHAHAPVRSFTLRIPRCGFRRVTLRSLSCGIQMGAPHFFLAWQSEENTKGEEKANRNTRPLQNP